MSTAEQVIRLREQIERANNSYYVLNAPETSDAEYNLLSPELLEAAHQSSRVPAASTSLVAAHPEVR